MSKPFCKCKEPKIKVFREDLPSGQMDIHIECSSCNQNDHLVNCKFTGCELEGSKEVKPGINEDGIEYIFCQTIEKRKMPEVGEEPCEYCRKAYFFPSRCYCKEEPDEHKED